MSGVAKKIGGRHIVWTFRGPGLLQSARYHAGMKMPFATVEYAGNDLLVATTPTGHAQVLDLDGSRSSGASPLELLLVALGGCTGADVISILRKKRQRITGYRVEVQGERREEHPRSYRRFEVRHIVRGYAVEDAAVARAIELSTNKYCGVAATVRPTAEIVTSYRIEEEPASLAPTSSAAPPAP
jgi:putative redox protein